MKYNAFTEDVLDIFRDVAYLLRWVCFWLFILAVGVYSR